MHKKNLVVYIIPLLAFIFLSTNSFADEIELAKNHPHRHVVVKGDTLWGIAGKFLKTPWSWPKIWRMNRNQIKNPRLIYPGDVVVLDTNGKYPQLRLLQETVTLEPSVRIEKLEKEAIKTIPPNIITPFLTQPLLIENGQLDDAPRIVASQGNRLVLGPGTRIYINEIPKGEKTHWAICRPGEDFIDPDTQEVLGTEALYLGDLNVTRFGKPATGNILRAKEEIFTKDRLIAASDEYRESFVPRAPEKQMRGRILRVYGGVAEAGPSDVVSINLGKNDGIAEGHVLAISRYGNIIKDPGFSEEKLKKAEKALLDESTAIALKPGQLKLPDERVGLLMVFRTFDRVSYGLIMSASDSVHTLDAVHTP